MPVDYDLVIIGYSLAGIQAALQAARYKARVALVEQRCQPRLARHQAISRIAQTLHAAAYSNHLHFFDPIISAGSLQFNQVNQWIDAIAQTQQEFHAPEKLAAAGIEVVQGRGEFCRKPQSGFIVNGRLLRSRAYLIATDYHPIIPDVPGLQSVGFITPETVLNEQPKSLVILGDDPIAVELAQLYTRLGTKVTMVVRQPHILSLADPEVAFLVQAQLEAEGVRIVSALQIMQISQHQQKRIQTENYTIEADEILLAIGWQPQTDDLNLEAMGIREPIRLTERLQTSHPRVYWCAYPIEAIAQYQAQIAVKNALFASIFKPNYSSVAQSIATNPELAWVGLSESQAVRKYGKDVVILRQSFNRLIKAQVASEITGICKIITRRNGQILGVHIVGLDASELICSIALAMQQRIPIQKFERLAMPSPALSEVLRNVATEWQNWKFKRNSILQDFCQSYFVWQRSRIK